MSELPGSSDDVCARGRARADMKVRAGKTGRGSLRRLGVKVGERWT
jgi:hypothetical protein